MPTTKRTLLIVEDNELLNTFHKTYCETVLQELPHLEGTIKQAFNYHQAKEILETQPIDFISVDIALTREEQDKTDQQRAEADAGGMKLLKELQQTKNPPLAVIVSGETLQSYALDAYRRYGVLAFYQKARFDDSEYMNAIKAALYYLDTAQALSHLETELDIEVAKKSWQKGLEAARMANIVVRDFPQDMGQTIELKRSELTNAVTGLPESRWTEEQLTKQVAWRPAWGLIQVTIKGFSDFVTAYASQEEPILFFVANLLKRAREECTECQDSRLFIGHLGHHQHLADPNFIIVPSNETNRHCLADISDWINKEFKKSGSAQFSPQVESKSSLELVTFTVEAKVITGTEVQAPEQLLDMLGSMAS